VTSEEAQTAGARRSVVRRMVDAPTEPADLTTLARRRRIAHLIAVALLIVMIVALTFSPNDDNDTSAASLIVGLSAILLLATGMTSVQYTVRIDRRRRARKAAARVVTTSELTVPAGSAAYQPIQQLRSAHRLLESALPDIEPVRKGIGAAAEQTRSSLEQTGRRVLLQEQVLATLSGSAEPGELRIAETRHNLKTMTDRLQSGPPVDLSQIRVLEPQRRLQRVGPVGLFPGQLDVGTAEMAVGGGRRVDRT